MADDSSDMASPIGDGNVSASEPSLIVVVLGLPPLEEAINRNGAGHSSFHICHLL